MVCQKHTSDLLRKEKSRHIDENGAKETGVR